jgi:hypothetical protein
MRVSRRAALSEDEHIDALGRLPTDAEMPMRLQVGPLSELATGEYAGPQYRPPVPACQEIFDRDGSVDAPAVLDLGDGVPRFEAVAVG